MHLPVIDDDPDQRQLLERALDAAGHRVETSADGRPDAAAGAETRRPIPLDVPALPSLSAVLTGTV